MNEIAGSTPSNTQPDHAIRNLVGQSIMLRIDGQVANEETRSLLAATRACGVILFSYNISGPEQLHALCSGLQQQAADLGLPPLLISIDQEGGVVSRLPPPFVVLPSNLAVGSSGDPELAYQAAVLTGQLLRAHGVNMNLAPDLDVGNNPLNPVAGTRSYGPDPAQVAKCGVEAVRGYRETKVLCTLKHFPGKGDTTIDSHLGLPVAHHDLARLEAIEFPPFRAGIAAGAPAIMTSHMVYTVFDSVPGTISPRMMRELAREEMGFDGLILSDALDMNAIADTYGAPQAGVLCKRAGVDILLPLGDFANHVAVVDALLAALEAGELEVAHFAETERRLAVVREQYDLGAKTPPPAPISAEQIARCVEITRRCLKVDDSVGLLPIDRDSEILVIDCLQPRFNNAEDAVARADMLRGFLSAALPKSRYFYLLPNDPRQKWDDALAGVSGAWVTLLVTRNATFVEEQQQMAKAVLELAPRLIHLVARGPNDVELTPGATHLLTYGDQPLGLQSAVDRLVA